LNLVAEGYIQFSCKNFVFAKYIAALGGFPLTVSPGAVPLDLSEGIASKLP